jgi:hypothetical protein
MVGLGRTREPAKQVGPLLEQIASPVASFTGDGAYDRDDVYREVCQRHPDAVVIVPPRSGAMADSAPTKRDRHLQLIAERGRMQGHTDPPSSCSDARHKKRLDVLQVAARLAQALIDFSLRDRLAVERIRHRRPPSGNDHAAYWVNMCELAHT